MRRIARYSTASTVGFPFLPRVSCPAQRSWYARLTRWCVGDVPMARVKFNVNTEYAYIQNFKILQSMRSLSL